MVWFDLLNAKWTFISIKPRSKCKLNKALKKSLYCVKITEGNRQAKIYTFIASQGT